MSEATFHAIVLRRRDSGESDRRLTVLTFEEGKIDVVAKGARKGGSRLAGISDPLSAAILSVAKGRHSRFITQAQPQSSFRGLRADYERLSFALALSELYAAVLPWEQPLPETYELLIQSLRHLEAHPKPIVALLWAEIHLLDVSGFAPQFDRCVQTEAPLDSGEPFLSPSAGGYVCEAAAAAYMDRYRVRAEALYALARLPELDEPPANIRFAVEALAALFPIWRAIAESPLPANESAVQMVRHGH